MIRGAGRYGALFVVLVVALGFAASYTVAAMIDETRATPAIVPLDGADTFAVKDPHLIRPTLDAFRRFASEDSAWRARFAPPVRWESMGDVVWRPSARQVVFDSAYALTGAGRMPEAVALLERWMSSHPADADAGLELARLLNTVGRSRDAVARYRLVLRLRPSLAVRSELATTLLEAEMYDEAAVEFSALLATRDDPVWRLGRARALAWGEHGREAEADLARLAALTPGDTSIAGMLRWVRATFEPTAAEARRWVAESPEWTPYRLAFARALVREGQVAQAAAQFDTIVAGEATVALLREAAGVHATAADSSGSAALLGRAVAMTPEDDGLRLDWARALAWSGDRDGAIREYGTLLTRRPSAELYLARGELYAWSGRHGQAEADLAASIRLNPTYEAYVLVGDVRRWRSDYGGARDAYRRALALRPGDARTLAALRTLDRDERIYLASVPSAEPGWTLRSEYAEDNTGFLFLSAGGARGFRLSDNTTVSVGAEQRRVSQRFVGRPERYSYGVAAEVRARQQLRPSLAVVGHAGIAKHALVPAVPTGGVGLYWSRRGASAYAGISQEMAYRSLMSLWAVAPASEDMLAVRQARALTGRVMTLTTTVPLGLAMVTLTGDRVALSDGNVRNEVDATVRVPVSKSVNAVYSGGALGYSKASSLYWDPRTYRSHSAGVEVNMRGPLGTQVAVRALPGIARSDERIDAVPGVPLAPRKNVFQLNTGAEVLWQRERMSVSAGVGYGRGREGSYQSLNGAVTVRIGW